MWCKSSHDEECTEDSWNLYQHIERVEGLNTSGSGAAPGQIFKPYDRRLDPSPCVLSDVDGEFILKVWFLAPVNIRKLCVASCGDASGLVVHPSSVQCFVGTSVEDLDFESLDEVMPVQTIELPPNPQAEHSFTCALKPFSQVSFVLLRIRGPHESAGQTRVSYIGLQGEHSHTTRQPVIAKYEVSHSSKDVQGMDELDAGSDNHDVQAGQSDVDSAHAHFK